jgi:hypothetical protein
VILSKDAKYIRKIGMGQNVVFVYSCRKNRFWEESGWWPKTIGDDSWPFKLE